MSDYAVNRDRWAQLSIFAQMGNIYAEVGRSFSAKSRNQRELAHQAAVRVFDLFDATAEHLAQFTRPRTICNRLLF